MGKITMMDGIETMGRAELEKLATESIVALQQLDEENKQLLFDIESSANIDVKIISGWRDLINSSETERDKWAKLATEMSLKNQALTKENERLKLVIEKILQTLDSLAKKAHDNADPKLKAIKLSRIMQKLRDEANEAKSEILGFFIEGPDNGTNEQS